jgi:hypothetical protein
MYLVGPKAQMSGIMPLLSQTVQRAHNFLKLYSCALTHNIGMLPINDGMSKISTYTELNLLLLLSTILPKLPNYIDMNSLSVYPYS